MCLPRVSGQRNWWLGGAVEHVVPNLEEDWRGIGPPFLQDGLRWPQPSQCDTSYGAVHKLRNQLGLTRLPLPHRILLSFGGTAPNLSSLMYFMVSPSSDFLFLIILWNTNCRSAAWNSISDYSCLKPDLTFDCLINFWAGSDAENFLYGKHHCRPSKKYLPGLENKIARPSAISCGFNFGIMAQIWSWAPLAEF